MRKFIRILEVPILLLTISFGTCLEGSYGTAIFLLVVSVTRLWVNVITDNIIYKNENKNIWSWCSMWYVYIKSDR